MKIWFRLTDDLGFKGQCVNVLDGQVAWDALEQIVADPELKKRFGGHPNVCLNLEVMPLHRREGAVGGE